MAKPLPLDHERLTDALKAAEDHLTDARLVRDPYSREMAQALRAAEDHLQAATHIVRGVANHGPAPGGAEAALARVRELHPAREVPAIHSENPTAARPAYTECATCYVPYPCPTIREIDGSTDE